ncbi:hypothetical protein BASA81_012109 [Batrachochytrium salamandrivorans]|nr:hypothetical protein BASA81_012109 [Batrachochytrium salamandrivorans]
MKSIDFAQARLGLRRSEPPVVRHSFYVQDLTPDPEPSFVIPERLAIGSQDCAFSPATRRDFTHVVNVGYGIPNAFPHDLCYKQINLPDLVEFNPLPLFREVHEFIDQALESEEGKVLVHCQAGVSRSVLMVVSYLQLVRARHGQRPSFQQCYEQVKLARPCAQPNAGFVQTLKQWEQVLVDRYPSTTTPIAPKPALPAPLPMSTRLTRLANKLRFIWLLVRPTATLISGLVSVTATGRRRGRLVLLLFALYNLFRLSRDAVFRANWLGRLGAARPGVYFDGNMAGIMRHVLPHAEYKAPQAFTLLGGDVATCAFALADYRGCPTLGFGRHWVSQSGRSFALDWAFPTRGEGQASTCCLLMAGIGGGSDSAYVRDVTRHLVDHGFVVCVLLCNDGGAHTSPTATLDGMFNPSTDGEAQLAMQLVADLYPRVLLVGFSLGGVAVCRLLSPTTGGGSVPANVLGGVSVSGSFDVGFISLPRYATYYQSVLVAGLVDRIVNSFGEEIASRVGGLDGVFACETYEHMHRELYVGARLPEVEPDFVQWKRKLGSSPANLVRPLLLLTDLADPLHHCEHLGINHVWEEGSASLPNLAVVVTNGGGHVAWPQHNFTQDGYAYIRKVVLAFCQGVATNGKMNYIAERSE